MAKTLGWPKHEWMRDREKLESLRQHLVDSGWSQGEGGDPEIYDQGAAMAAEVCEFVLELLHERAQPVDMHGQNFLAGARLLVEEHAHSFCNMMQADGTRPGLPLNEVIGLAAMEMQMLAERVARLYAAPPSAPTPPPEPTPR